MDDERRVKRAPAGNGKGKAVAKAKDEEYGHCLRIQPSIAYANRPQWTLDGSNIRWRRPTAAPASGPATVLPSFLQHACPPCRERTSGLSAGMLPLYRGPVVRSAVLYKASKHANRGYQAEYDLPANSVHSKWHSLAYTSPNAEYIA